MHQNRPIWFGLTQREEARWGFDAAGRLRRRVVLLQFKASNHQVGAWRRFRLDHQQLVNLQVLAQNLPRAVFYAFPDIGNTRELVTVNRDLLGNLWLLRVANLPYPFPPPTTKAGNLRKDGKHYADLQPPWIKIHSEPVKVKAKRASDLFDQGDIGEWVSDVPSTASYAGLHKVFRRSAAGCILPR